MAFTLPREVKCIAEESFLTANAVGQQSLGSRSAPKGGEITHGEPQRGGTMLGLGLCVGMEKVEPLQGS